MSKRQFTDSVVASSKKVKLEDDRIDPVEKLLSMNSCNTSILDDNLIENSDDDYEESDLPESPLSINFNQLLYENIQTYLSNRSKSNSTNCFQDLNSSATTPITKQTKSTFTAPFFKNVNFMNNTRQCLNDYFEYDNASDNSDDESPDSPLKSPSFQVPKISFHYRHKDTFNLIDDSYSADASVRGLKSGSIVSGKASEMMGSGGFLINDFFL
jgi:hypothetical protein